MNKKNKIIKKIQGFSLVELIVAIAIFSILSSGVVYVFTTSYRNFFGVGDKQVIVQFAQEGMEAVRNIRNNGWQSIVSVSDGNPRGVEKNIIPLLCGEYSLTSDLLTYGTIEAADEKCWLDRNIGASRVASATNDTAAYGHLYQWGRSSDGHNMTRYSIKNATLSSSDTPAYPYFITSNSEPYDWRSPQNDSLWQGVSGTNNVCPTGFRLPTSAEWAAVLTAENITNQATAYSSSLKIPASGYRVYNDAIIYEEGIVGNYWSSTVSGNDAFVVWFNGSSFGNEATSRGYGIGVRCVKEVVSPCGETVTLNSLSYDTITAADGKCWLDRNIGASRVAQAVNDTAAYGHLYQWGRSSDGHEMTKHSGTTTTLSSSDTPVPPYFIKPALSPYDWRSPQNNNLWQGVSGTNNVCPSGARLPTSAEWAAVLTAENITNQATAYSSSLKIPASGYRVYNDAIIYEEGIVGNYWSSTVSGNDAFVVWFNGSSFGNEATSRSYGIGVRCLVEQAPVSSYFSWQFSDDTNTLNGLTREVVVSDVLRNSSGAIVESNGIDDPNTKKVTVTVSGAGIADYVLVTYFTNWSAKMWEQTDWSGTSPSEFWSNVTMASSTYSNISTSTAGQVKLQLVASEYSTPGSLVSSIFDLGSTDKVLTSLKVDQEVPSGCSLTLTLEGSDSSSFASYTSNDFVDNSTNIFTSSTPTSLNNLRYMRYRLALTACNSNTQTPVLHSMRLNFY